MFQENLLESQQDELDFLLNYSRISEAKMENSFHQFSISRDKLDITEKERTREESYQDIMKQIHQTKLEKLELLKQLDHTKTQIYTKYLNNFQHELQEINEQNIRLRKELNYTIKRNNDDRSQKYSNRSPIKLRTSVKSQYGNQNKKTNTKAQKNRASPNMVLVKKDIKITESTTNLGRSQVHSPINHKKRQSQLTQRKIEDNSSLRMEVNISMMDERIDEFNIKQSVSRQNLEGLNSQGENIFIKILENILQQQKQYEQQEYGQLEKYLQQRPEKNINKQIHFINEMEGEISQTNQKIEMLNLVLIKFQKQMKDLNINLKNAEEWTRKLWEVKGKYIEMQKRCALLVPLRKQVQQKQEKLLKLKYSYMGNKQQEKSICSVETMLRLLIHPSKTFSQTSKLYLTYYKQIKQLFKFDKQTQTKRTHKIMKVKQTIDSIRQGRKKFNELIHIYQSRISKLQEKIMKVRNYNQKLRHQ